MLAMLLLDAAHILTRLCSNAIPFMPASVPRRLAGHVFSVVAARARERGLQSAAVLVSEGDFGVSQPRPCGAHVAAGSIPRPCRVLSWGAKHGPAQRPRVHVKMRRLLTFAFPS